MSDPLKGVKVGKQGNKDRVAIGSSGEGEGGAPPPLPENGPEGDAPPPPDAPEQVPPPAQDAAGDNFDADPVPSLPAELVPKPVPTWEVLEVPKKGLMVNGQRIKFKVGEQFTLRDWSHEAVGRFESSGLKLKRVV